MPMHNTSTPIPKISSSSKSATAVRLPKKSTLEYIRQFARIYVPVTAYSGVVLN